MGFATFRIDRWAWFPRCDVVHFFFNPASVQFGEAGLLERGVSLKVFRVLLIRSTYS